MNNREFVSRVSSQLKMITKDDYQSDRYILSAGITIASKLITQKIQRRSLDRDMSLYTEIPCIEFESVDIFKCKYHEFKTCKKLSKSKKNIKDIGLLFTRYGSSIKELYSIERQSNVFTESTLYQLRLDSQREGGGNYLNKFYIIDSHIYIPQKVQVLSGLVLALDQYELDNLFDCTEDCESAWDKEFICPDSILEDVIGYTIQQISVSKQIPTDEAPNLNSNEK